VANDFLSLGLVILEAAANVVLPDNGLPWRKLRSNDFSDVNLSLLSTDLVLLVQSMMEKNPDRRPAIYAVLKHPVTNIVCEARGRALKEIEETSSSTAAGRQGVRYSSDSACSLSGLTAQGAICPEDESFLEKILAAASAELPGTPSPCRTIDDMAMELDEG
jgi:serine/threonine protein kinase